MNDTTDNKISADWVLHVLKGMAKAYENHGVHCGNCVHNGQYSGQVGAGYCFLKKKNLFLGEALECRDFKKSPYRQETPLQCDAEKG